MRLYTLVRTDWEKMIQEKSSGKFHNKKPGAAKKKQNLNNKSELLAGIQKDLCKSGTRQYVDSDSEWKCDWDKSLIRGIYIFLNTPTSDKYWAEEKNRKGKNIFCFFHPISFIFVYI